MDLDQYRKRLRCGVPQIEEIFAGCMAEAAEVMSEEGIGSYLDGATALCGLGRGTDLPVIFLEEMPSVVRIAGEEILTDTVALSKRLSDELVPKAIGPLLANLPACARRLREASLLREYFRLIERMALEGGEGLVPMILHIDDLLGQVSIGGLANWIDYGLRAYREQPHRMGEYFGLKSPDARAALQRERHGTLFVDRERALSLYLRSFWDLEEEFHPLSSASDPRRSTPPHLDRTGFHIPDLYDDAHGVAAMDRYRALIAHMAAHRLWTRPVIADNFNRYQHLFIEAFEDSRVEWLAMRRYPGLRRLYLKLHPIPVEGACPADRSPVRHKMAILSRAILDPGHGYRDPVLLEFVAEFQRRVEVDPFDANTATDLGVRYLTAVHEPSFRFPDVWFKDTLIDYRDDNRYLWIFLEDTDEDDFHSDHAVANPEEREGGGGGFSRHHPEWDHAEQIYRPDWVTVYEAEQSPGDPAAIDRILEKHAPLVRRLRRIVDLLKPQQHARVRFQEEGTELDLDIALRAMVEIRSGISPDPRIHYSHIHDGRDISVMLLLDLSKSINERPKGLDGTILELSREAVTLLAVSIEALGDPFAISGFASNTRHDVRYVHFKGFSERFDTDAKARLAGMSGDLSTRMGAALRHAGHYLSRRASSKRLLLVLTDGEPSDIDVEDPHYLRADTHRAVEELVSKGIHTFCITLDPNADGYAREIFGANGYAVIDRINRLPEMLPQIFMSLTR